jgi:2-C-methyl-D-erythritol 4-phosphate cytidylyltransferase
MTVHVIFPAAGIGTRFGAETPKQYTNIAGKSVMEWTLLAWQGVSIDGLKIVVKSKDDNHCAAILGHIDSDYLTIAGGQERSDSVLNALAYLRKHGQADDWVMVHDIARPCVRKEDIEALLYACKLKKVGGILAKPMTDTVKQQNHEKVTTIERSSLWSALTPQCFQLSQLHDALQESLDKGLQITDEANAIELAGHSVQLIEGSSDNIKLTHSEDAELIHFFLQKQKRITDV